MFAFCNNYEDISDEFDPRIFGFWYAQINTMQKYIKFVQHIAQNIIRPCEVPWSVRKRTETPKYFKITRPAPIQGPSFNSSESSVFGKWIPW
jgi:hypothetical protein